MHFFEVSFLGIEVYYMRFEAFMVTIHFSLRWSAMQKWNCYQMFWRHCQPASSRFDVMSITSVCSTYTQCCQSLVSCLRTELCPCLSKLHWRPQVACHAACLVSGGWNPLSITVVQQTAIEYVGCFVGYAELDRNHITSCGCCKVLHY
jgi:hypothetical protein